jgi:hypothetical protein
MHKMDQNEYTITQRIAKHGEQAVLVIQKVLQNELRPGTIAEVRIRIVREAEQ